MQRFALKYLLWSPSDGFLCSIMLLLTAPLLFLLGTSVVALKPEYVGPNLIPVGQNPTRRPPAQVRLDNRLIHTIVGFWDRIPTKVQNTFNHILDHPSHTCHRMHT